MELMVIPAIALGDTREGTVMLKSMSVLVVLVYMKVLVRIVSMDSSVIANREPVVSYFLLQLLLTGLLIM